jgi:hypothetical protein
MAAVSAMPSLGGAASSMTNQRRGSFARGASARVQARRPISRKGVKGANTKIFSVMTPSAPSSTTGGTTISDQELATDASAGNPLIGITPDREPMAAAAAKAKAEGKTFNWEKQW